MLIANPSTPPLPGRLMRVVAPAAALSYPGLIACGTRISPVFLIAALCVPAIGLVAARKMARPTRTPRASAIAHLAVAAPALFSMLGGWLDFQHLVPLDSTTVWIPLWSALVVVAWMERPIDGPTTSMRGRGLAFAHGISASLISLFIAAHLVNHLGGLWGGDAHVAIMRALRTVYRARFVEPVLLIAVVFQVASGAVLLWRKLRRANDRLDTLQTASGAYLLVFFASHVGAVMRARHLRGIDTSWPWLSTDELLTDPWSARLVPYYFLAVIAFGAHAGCGLRTIAIARGRSLRTTWPVVALTAIAATASVLILIGLLR